MLSGRVVRYFYKRTWNFHIGTMSIPISFCVCVCMCVCVCVHVRFSYKSVLVWTMIRTSVRVEMQRRYHWRRLTKWVRGILRWRVHILEVLLSILTHRSSFSHSTTTNKSSISNHVGTFIRTSIRNNTNCCVKYCDN